MARAPSVSFRAVLLLASLFPLACSTDSGVGCGRDPGPGGVNVVLALPKGEVDWVSSVDVSFDHSMVELGAGTAEAGRGNPIRLKPKVSGRFNWIGTRTASFIPDKPLAFSTKYKVTVPAGLRSVDGKSVGKDVTWEFTTPTVEVVRSFPESPEPYLENGSARDGRGRARTRLPGVTASTPVPPDLIVVLEFNQPVDPSAVERAARLAPAGREGNEVPLRALRPGKDAEEILKRWPEAPDAHRVVLKPRKPLEKDTVWELSLGPSLKGSEGPLPMGEAWRLPFRTYGPFRIRAVRSNNVASETVILDLTNPVNTDSLVARLRLTPEVRLRGAWQGPDPADTGVYGDFQPGITYSLTVSDSLRDVFGNPIEPPASPLTFTMGDVDPMVRIAPYDAVLELSGSREIAILLTNVSSARLELRRLSIDQVPEFLKAEMYGQGGLWPMPGTLSETVTRRTPKNVTDTLRVSTDRVLGPGGGGVVAVSVISLDPVPRPPGSTSTPPPPRDRTLLRVTDLGVTSKASETGGIAWVTSLRSGQPIEGVDLEIRDVLGRRVWNGPSGADGIARTAGISLHWESPPTPYRLFARKGNDFTFLTLGRDWALEAWNFGISSERWDPEKNLDGFVFGDRELYRPGETARLKAILRRRTAAGLEAPPEGTRVRLEVSDARGEPILSEVVTLSRFGTFDREIPLSPRARPGSCGILITADDPPEQRRWSVWGTFRVEEYRAPEFQVEVTAKRPWYSTGQALEADVAASYLFGAPLSAGSVNWSLSRRPAWFSPPGYEEYTFNDPEISPDYDLLAGRGEAKLDLAGKARLTPMLDLGGLPVSMDYTLEAEVRDLTGQASASEVRVTVHRGLAYPGVRVPRDLVREGEMVPVSVVLVSPDGRPAANANGRVSLVRREWRTARRLMVGGFIGSETAPVDSVLESRTLPAGPGPHTLDFKVPGPGYYRVVVEATDGAKNTLKSAGDFYAYGAGSYSWGWEPGVRLDLVTDRERYTPGDVAKILVRSPFSGALALVTVEREGIRSFETRRLAGTSETIEIPIPEEGAAPNLHVSVALVTGSAARNDADPRIRLPEFRMGYATLEIDHRSRVLAVSITPAKTEALPGDSLGIEVRLTDAAGRPVAGEVALAVVDEAVLRLLGTKTPDPVAHFYRPRGVSVITSELRRLVRRAVGDGADKGEAGGGGGADEAFRSLFATTAYWNPSLHTDASGRARAAFRLPDNLTTFRITAVALDGADRFGSAENRITVTKPLLVQPALPRFANAGDSFRIGAVVHNRTAGSMSVDVTANVEGLRAAGPGSTRISIRPGESARADFEVRAETPGTARVRFQAQGAAYQDGVQVSFPVVLPAAGRKEASSGVVAETVTEGVAVPAAALSDSSRLQVTLAPTLIGRVRNAFEYLADYPYACLEQTASAEWARLLAARLFKSEPLADAGRRTVERLAPYQKDDGGFASWPGYEPASSPSTTAWALLVLAEAERAGANVDALARPAVQYMNWMFDSAEGDTLGRLTRASEWAMALWALSEFPDAARGAPPATSRLDFLMASRTKLNATARLYLSLALNRTPGGDAAARAILAELDNRVEQVADQAFVRDAVLDGFDLYWYSPIRLTGLYLMASIRSGRNSPLEPAVVRWLMEQQREARWPSTQDNIMALLGLVAFREAYENVTPDLEVTVLHDGRAVGTRLITSLEQPPVVVAWPAGAPGTTTSLQVAREGPGALYYTAALHYLEPTIGGRPVETSLTLVRSYEAFDPAAAGSAPRRGTKIRAGDLVLVRLTLVVPEASDFLALADPLPAGLEPVNLGFVTTAREAARRYLATGVYEPGRSGLPVEHEEQRDREVRAFSGHLPPGVYEYRYLARAITAGRFAAPRARAELMYHPEVVALTDGPWIEIAPR